ncbi:MAG: sugar kinase [Cyanobacteriota bacterium]|nr:sugar kinase [Cyanobacteriota bacterium]
MKTGLFVGAITLDLVYRVEEFPSANQKAVASDRTIAAGGPATNASVAFSALGNRGTVMGVLGAHPISELIRSDLANCGVEIADLQPDFPDPPTVSSIVVTQSTGERAVISTNTTKAKITTHSYLKNKQKYVLENIDILLIDGHQMELSEAIAREAKTREIPVVIDGGSWKPQFDRVLRFADYAICSANFFPPNCPKETELENDRQCDRVIAELQNFGIPNIAITYGDRPIQALSDNRRFQIEVSQIQAVDTLGAGDIFHGAFCHYILECDFAEALARSAEIAARACQSFGTRNWLREGMQN